MSRSTRSFGLCFVLAFALLSAAHAQSNRSDIKDRALMEIRDFAIDFCSHYWREGSSKKLVLGDRSPYVAVDCAGPEAEF